MNEQVDQRRTGEGGGPVLEGMNALRIGERRLVSPGVYHYDGRCPDCGIYVWMHFQGLPKRYEWHPKTEQCGCPVNPK